MASSNEVSTVIYGRCMKQARPDICGADRDSRDAARYRWLANRMTHVGNPGGAGWTLDEVLASGDRDLDDVIDALMAREAERD
jgi:hypothetical protein